MGYYLSETLIELLTDTLFIYSLFLWIILSVGIIFITDKLQKPLLKIFSFFFIIIVLIRYWTGLALVLEAGIILISVGIIKLKKHLGNLPLITGIFLILSAASSIFQVLFTQGKTLDVSGDIAFIIFGAFNLIGLIFLTITMFKASKKLESQQKY